MRALTKSDRDSALELSLERMKTTRSSGNASKRSDSPAISVSTLCFLHRISPPPDSITLLVLLFSFVSSFARGFLFISLVVSSFERGFLFPKTSCSSLKSIFAFSLEIGKSKQSKGKGTLLAAGEERVMPF